VTGNPTFRERVLVSSTCYRGDQHALSKVGNLHELNVQWYYALRDETKTLSKRRAIITLWHGTISRKKEDPSLLLALILWRQFHRNCIFHWSHHKYCGRMFHTCLFLCTVHSVNCSTSDCMSGGNPCSSSPILQHDYDVTAVERGSMCTNSCPVLWFQISAQKPAELTEVSHNFLLSLRGNSYSLT
jgi:hypothetical protein